MAHMSVNLAMGCTVHNFHKKSDFSVKVNFLKIIFVIPYQFIKKITIAMYVASYHMII